MKDLIQIHYDNADRPTVSGRELHEALGAETMTGLTVCASTAFPRERTITHF